MPLNVVEFDVGSDSADGRGGPLTITPRIDGVSLIDLVGDYERRHSYEPAGGYGGLIPAYFRFGDLEEYFLAGQEEQWPEPGRAWLLGCDCGEVGCWPLEARIIVLADHVTWTDFAQVHRPQRSYESFGPFTFDRIAYVDAVHAVAEQVPAD